MAAFDYAEAISDAHELINEFGRAGKLVRPTSTGPEYDPTDGVPIETPVTLAITSFRNREIDGTRILSSDKKAYVSALGLTEEPTTDHQLVAGTEKPYSIIAVEPLNPAGTVVFYKLQVRR